MSNKEYLLELGFKVTDINSQKQINKLADAVKNFEFISKQAGTTFKDIFKNNTSIGLNVDEITTAQDATKLFIANLEEFGMQVSKRTKDTTQFTTSLTDLSRQLITVYKAGGMKVDYLPSEALKGMDDYAQRVKTEYTGAISDAFKDGSVIDALNMHSILSDRDRKGSTLDANNNIVQEYSNLNQMLGADKSAKDALKAQISKSVSDSNQFSQEEIDNFVANFDKYVNKISVSYDKDGKATKVWVDAKINEYTRLKQGIEYFEAQTTGGDIVGRARVGQANIEVDRSSEQRDINQYIKEYEALIKKQSELSKNEDVNSPKLAQNSKEIDEVTTKLSKYGIQVDKSDTSNRKLTQSFDSATVTYVDATKSISNLNKSIDNMDANRATEDLKEQKTSAIALVEAFDKLAKEQIKLSSNKDSQFDFNLPKVNSELEDLTNELSKYGISVSKAEDGSMELSASTEGIASNFKDVVTAIDKTNKSLVEYSNDSKNTLYNQEVKDYVAEVKKLYEAELQLLKLKNADAQYSDIEEQQKTVEMLRISTNKYSDNVKNNSKALQANEMYTAKLKAEQDKLENNMNRVGVSFGNFTTRLKHSIENTLIYGTLYKSFSMTDQAISASVAKIKELDTAMTQIQMVTGQTDEQTRKVIQTYSDLAVQLGATTLEVADGSIEWLRQGKTVEQTNELLTASTMLSKVGMIEASEATELMTA